MSNCEEIVNKAIEDYKINRTITATTWLNILVSLTFIVSFIFYSSNKYVKDKNNEITKDPRYALFVILLIDFIMNLFISSFFLSKSDEERKKNEFNIATQSFALQVLFILIMVYLFINRNKLKKVINDYTLNVSAISIFIFVYVALLITSIEQSKKL